MYELTNMVVEEHVAKMDTINNKKTPSDVPTPNIETENVPENESEELIESGDKLIDGTENFSLF